MLAPLALGVLGRQAHSQGLGAGGLASMLAGQSGLLANMLPGGLGKLLGGGMPGRDEETWRTEVERPREVPSQLRTSEPIRPAEREAPRRRFGVPAIALAIGLALVAWALLRQKRPDVERQARTPTATQPSEVTPGMRQAAPRQGIDALASYSGPNLEGQRFTIEETALETGTAKLVSVMKERGGMKVRLEGERASSVRDALAASGIAAERVTIAEMRPGQPAAQAQVDVVVIEQ
jgi:hypothetical protein